MNLLCLLASSPNNTFSKEEIASHLWPKTIIGDDTIARCVSKLRKALGDNAKSPVYIETISKQGYRLIQSVSDTHMSDADKVSGLTNLVKDSRTYWLVAFGLMCLILINNTFYKEKPISEAEKLTLKADILYNNYTKIDNEAALILYEKAIVLDPNYALAYAGLANSMIQNVIRWQPPADDNIPKGSGLTYALENNLTTTKSATVLLESAHSYAEKSFSLSPEDPDVLKALALSYSVQGNFDSAIIFYKQSIAANENAWRSLINLAELYQIKNQPSSAIKYLMRAYKATEKTYQKNPFEVSLWQSRIEYLIGREHENAGDFEKAKIWYKRVISNSPYDIPSNLSLASLLSRTGFKDDAQHICDTIQSKIGVLSECQKLLKDPR